MRRFLLMLGFAVAALTVSAQEEKLVLSLEQALEIALSENPTIKIADQQIEIKRYAKQGTYASLYPQIDATASYQRVIKKQTMSMDFGGQTQTIKVGSDNSFNGGIALGMPVVNAQLWESLKVSALDVELAVEQARSSRIDMVEQVTKAYYGVLLAKESYNLFQRVYDNAVNNNEVVKKRFDVGSVSEYDLITSNVSVQNAQPNMIEAEYTVVLALWQLKALLGIDLQRDIDVTGSLMDYVHIMDRGYDISQLSLENNSTLKQLDMQEDMLNHALRITKFANIPSLSINAAYLYTALGNDGKFFKKEAWNPYSYAGLQLNIPIFAGNKRRAATREANLNLQNLQLQRENVERQLRVGIVQYLNNMQSSVKKYHASAATVDQAQRGYDIAVKRYDVGRGTLVDIDNSQVALVQAEMSRNQSVYNFLTAKVSLDKVLGDFDFENR
ncbi:MAG: TolC family protein [Alistipes sp.]|nr:TolC family protein [Alistipes sp.]MBQ6584123.1 TolC family protein [Alistipes sp.]MEE0915604.1 TolC family protein [Alistipes sp.]